MAHRTRVIVLNYNGGDHVIRCLHSLEALDWPSEDLELVVVDNASTDGSPARIEAILQDIDGARLIRNPDNTGFSANNLALHDLESVAAVALVNPDATVEPDWLLHLWAALDDDPSLGGACPKMLLATRFVDVDYHLADSVRVDGLVVNGRDHSDEAARLWRLLPARRRPAADATLVAGSGTLSIPLLDAHVDEADTCALRLRASRSTTVRIDGRNVGLGPSAIDVDVDASAAHDVINNAGIELRSHGYGGDRGLGEPDGPSFDRPVEVFGWTGGGALLRTAYLLDTGLFDDVFFLYYEDTDLSWRGRARLWRFAYVPSAQMRHQHAATTDEGSAAFWYHTERNRLVLVIRNAPARFVAAAIGAFLRSTLGHLRADVVLPAIRGRRPDLTVVLARLRALGSILAMGPRLLRDRRRLRRLRLVDDDRILDWIDRPSIDLR